MPFCIHCGKEVSEDALVCPYCGKELVIAPAPTEKQVANQVSGLEVAGLVLGAVGIAVMIGAGIDMISNAYWGSAGHFYSGVGTGFIGLGLFFAGILCLLFARNSKS
jgi:DNA-directed RNA polymerase subunit RPC12/RpoP